MHFVKKIENVLYTTQNMASRILHLWCHGHYSFVHFPMILK